MHSSLRGFIILALGSPERTGGAIGERNLPKDSQSFLVLLPPLLTQSSIPLVLERGFTLKGGYSG